MPAPLIAAVAAPAIGAIAGKLLGPKEQKAQAAVPKDLQGMRQNQIGLLNWLTGFGGPPSGLGSSGPPGGTRPHAGSSFTDFLTTRPNTGPGPTPPGPSPFQQWIGSHLQPNTRPQVQFSTGGAVDGPGGPTSDQVPALLSDGEYVLNAEAVRILGPELLELLNAVGAPKMAQGGMVQMPWQQMMQPGQPPMPPMGGPNIQPPAPGMGGPSIQPPAPQQGMGGPTIMPGQGIRPRDIQNDPPIDMQGALRALLGGGQGGGQGGPNIFPSNPNGGQGGGGQQPGWIDFNNQGSQNKGMTNDRLTQYFGDYGVGVNPLQNNAANAANRMLTQQSPEQRALEQFQPHMGQTGINQGAQNRLQQGATQSGIGQGVNNFYGGLLGGQPNLGPGSDIESILGQIGQTGGGMGGGDVMSRLMSMSQGGGGGAGNEGFLQQMLRQNPGAANQQLLDPQFQRQLEMANQTGGRFGSANAVMRGNAVTDHQAQLAQMLQTGTGQQLQAAGQLGQQAQAQRATQLQAQLQALGLAGNMQQQGVQNQLGAAGQLGGMRQQGAIAGLQGQLQGAGQYGQMGLQDIGQQLSAAQSLGNLGLQGQQNLLSGMALNGQLAGQAGAGMRQDIGQAFGIGSGLAGQADLETQRRMQMMMALMGQAQGASLNVPTTVTPSGAEQGAAIGGQVGNTIASYPWK